MRNSVTHDWNVLVSNSTITGSSGAGLYFELNMYSELYCGNTTANNNDSNFMKIVSTRFIDNMAEKFGGGLVVKLHDADCKPTDITLHYCTFHGSDSNGQGAAIKMYKYPTPSTCYLFIKYVLQAAIFTRILLKLQQ